MADEDDIKEQVRGELAEIHQRIAEVEIPVDKRKRAEKYWAEAMAILADKVGAKKGGK